MLLADIIAHVMLLVNAVESSNFEVLIEQPVLSPRTCESLQMYLEVGRGNFDVGNVRPQTLLTKVVTSFVKLSHIINKKACSQQKKGLEVLAQISIIWYDGIHALISPGSLNTAKHVEFVQAMIAAKVPEVSPNHGIVKFGVQICNQKKQICTFFGPWEERKAIECPRRGGGGGDFIRGLLEPPFFTRSSDHTDRLV